MAIDREETLANADALQRQGRLDAAIVEYRRVLDDYPSDWATANALGDCYQRAQQPDAAIEQYNRAADYLAAEGFYSRAAAIYKKTLKIAPAHEHALAQAADMSVRLGTRAEARTYLEALAACRQAREDAQGAAEALLRLSDLYPHDPGVRETVGRAAAAALMVGDAMRELRAAADLLELRGEEAAAIRLREEADALVPAADGGQPADAASDEPWNDEPLFPPRPLEPESAAEIGGEPLETSGVPPSPSSHAAEDSLPLGPVAVDLQDILGDDASGGAAGGSGHAAPARPSSGQQPAVEAPGGAIELDRVFQQLRNEVAPPSETDLAEQHFKVALAYKDIGMTADAVRELQLASRDPRLRFEASSLAARLLRAHGDAAAAIACFERAAEAPAPTAEAGRSLLYDLADALEATGATSRALALFTELRADAGEYRDVPRRIERLARVQTGG